MAYRPVVAPPSGALPMMRFAQPQGGAAPAVSTGDDLFYAVQSLLHGEALSDASLYSRTVTAALGSPAVSTTKFKFGTSSIRFPGGAILDVGNAPDMSWMHNSTWTLEGWFSFDSFAARRTLFSTNEGASANAGVFCAVTTGRQVNLQVTKAASGTFVVNGTFTGLIPNDTAFHHIAVQWSPTTGAACYIDGVSAGTLSNTGSAAVTTAAPKPLRLGGFATTGEMLGYMDDVRLTRARWRYAADFTPPASAFPDSP